MSGAVCVAVLAVLLGGSVTNADFTCLCNYAVQQHVHEDADVSSAVIGEMYEFDCKPIYTGGSSPKSGWTVVVIDHQVGYIQDTSTIQSQTCPGSPDFRDTVTTGPPTQSTATSTVPTTTSSSTSKASSAASPTTNVPTSISNTTTSGNTVYTTPSTTASTAPSTAPNAKPSTQPSTTMSSTSSTTASSTSSTTTRTTPGAPKVPTSTAPQSFTQSSPTTSPPTTTTTMKSTTLHSITHSPTTQRPRQQTTQLPGVPTTRIPIVQPTTDPPQPVTHIVNTYTCPQNVISAAHHNRGATTVYNDICYELVPYLYTWTSAEANCKNKGGHLLHVASQAEENAIMKFLYSVRFAHPVWTGLNDIGHEQHFTWTNGDPVTFTKWLSFHTNHFHDHNIEDCVLLVPNYKEGGLFHTYGVWDDVYCYNPYSWVCQYDAVPHSHTSYTTTSRVQMLAHNIFQALIGKRAA